MEVFLYNNTLGVYIKIIYFYFLFGSGVSGVLRIQNLIQESRSHFFSLKMAFIQPIHSNIYLFFKKGK